MRLLKSTTLNGETVGLQQKIVMNSYGIMRIFEGLMCKRLKFVRRRMGLYLKEKENRKKSINKRKILMRCVKQMLWTGRICLLTRPFWIWKLLIQKNYAKPVESMKRDGFSVLRALWNRFAFRKRQDILKAFKNWGQKPNSTNSLASHLLGLKYLNFSIKKVKNRYFQAFFQSSGQLKASLFFTNSIFKKRLQAYFKIWVNDLEYIYEEEYEEVVNSSKCETKRFFIIQKPCVQLSYFDNSTYDPAFRAVFRSLGHFLQKSQSHFFKRWLFPCKTHSIESLTTQFSLECHSSKLLPEANEKLKHLTSFLCKTNQKTLEMPLLALLKWSQSATLLDLKKLNLLQILIQIHSKFSKIKRVFNKLHFNKKVPIEFTDLF